MLRGEVLGAVLLLALLTIVARGNVPAAGRTVGRRMWCWGFGCGGDLENVAPKMAAAGKALLGDAGVFSIAPPTAPQDRPEAAPAKATPFRLPESAAQQRSADEADTDDEAVRAAKAARVRANRLRLPRAQPHAWVSSLDHTHGSAVGSGGRGWSTGGPQCPSPLDASARAPRRFFLGVGLVVRGEAPFIEEWARHYLAEGAERLYIVDQVRPADYSGGELAS